MVLVLSLGGQESIDDSDHRIIEDVTVCLEDMCIRPRHGEGSLLMGEVGSERDWGLFFSKHILKYWNLSPPPVETPLPFLRPSTSAI